VTSGKENLKTQELLREIRRSTRATKQNQDVRRLEQSEQEDTLGDTENNSKAQPE